ncbi:3-deoxy-D-manno-octulosonic acid transferase [Geobacter sp. DSM 9736]|uniref:3-deoxy-D-manno-octulosonic acid transferase n=1 Tax=Geobacter sp. DSM 9736 TaxID=1277350 RepID=UPI000B4FE179|nr:3-deoxy-D-manno-octulosonic acid transferase [Geobacter sp. DSM 9736]SNB45019.1 3-deoxy-D-manno-octulosonic-acid transferase [Geobacter sp. DSM 9736]
MTNVIYTLLLWVALPVVIAYHCFRSVSRGRPAALAERFGFVPQDELKGLSGAEVIWVHAVSVGETMAVVPLLKALKRRWPERKILLSNTTETGREVSGTIAEVDCRCYFPFDYPFAVSRLLRRVRPSLIVVVETEIWPNFLRTARCMGVPVAMVNGRISDRSFGRYLKLKRFFQPVLGCFSAFCMQSDEDARRIGEIGADPVKVHSVGNLKYDVPGALPSPDVRRELRRSYQIPENCIVFTAGSTHQGEDEVVIGAFRKVSAEITAMNLVLVPRHPERAAAVGELLSTLEIPFVLRSQLHLREKPLSAGEVLLVDRVGELNRLYSLSDIAFVGGSLVPTGGHNVLEPAACGVPVLFGPHMSNFREIAADILKSGGAIRVEDGAVMEESLRSLCMDPALRQEMGQRGLSWLQVSGGAVDRHIEVLARLQGREKSESSLNECSSGKR